MELTKISVKLSGLSDLLFDRFIDYSGEKRPPEQKLYLADGNLLVIPSANIDAFLFSENPQGCAKAFEKKAGKEYIRIGLGSVSVLPMLIPVLGKDDEEIIFKGFDGDSRWWMVEQGGRTKKGSLSIKQEAQKRPALKLPWSVRFQIMLIKNDKIDTTKLYNWFTKGGIEIGLLNYRPKFGRFEIAEWDEERIEN